MFNPNASKIQTQLESEQEKPGGELKPGPDLYSLTGQTRPLVIQPQPTLPASAFPTPQLESETFCNIRTQPPKLPISHSCLTAHLTFHSSALLALFLLFLPSGLSIRASGNTFPPSSAPRPWRIPLFCVPRIPCTYPCRASHAVLAQPASPPDQELR